MFKFAFFYPFTGLPGNKKTSTGCRTLLPSGWVFPYPTHGDSVAIPTVNPWVRPATTYYNPSVITVLLNLCMSKARGGMLQTVALKSWNGNGNKTRLAPEFYRRRVELIYRAEHPYEINSLFLPSTPATTFFLAIHSDEITVVGRCINGKN